MPARGQGMDCFSVRMTTKSGCEMWSDNWISMRALSNLDQPSVRQPALGPTVAVMCSGDRHLGRERFLVRCVFYWSELS